MDKDKFDDKLIKIESKSFEVNMLMAEFVFELLKTFDNKISEIYCELPYYDPDKGYKTLLADAVSLDIESGQIFIFSEMINTAFMWDDLNISAKEIIITELHLKYKSLKLFDNLTEKKQKEEMH